MKLAEIAFLSVLFAVAVLVKFRIGLLMAAVFLFLLTLIFGRGGA